MISDLFTGQAAVFQINKHRQIGRMTESETEGDWESLLDSGQLEANIKKLTILQRPRPESSQENKRMEVICSEEIEGRTQFKPSDPVIKIMKRPEKGLNKGGGPSVQSKPKTEQKSLKQREQEYAEARQRILGMLVYLLYLLKSKIKTKINF